MVSVSTETIRGLNALIWSFSSLMLVPAASPMILKLSGKRLTTSSVFVPIEPVEPKIDKRFNDVSPAVIMKVRCIDSFLQVNEMLDIKSRILD